MLPNFIILGPPKCASTSLHFYLNQHPDIFMSPVKEPAFFSSNFEKGLKFYEGYFREANEEHIIGESTAVYSFLPFVADRIKSTLPDVKLLLCLRNPVERAFSGWLMRSGIGDEKLNFIDALAANLDQLEQVSFEGDTGAAHWGRAMDSLVQKNEVALRTYIEGGQYSSILETYYGRFRRDQILVVLFEDLKTAPDQLFTKIFEFLGVDPSVIVSNLKEKNEFKDRSLAKRAIHLMGRRNAQLLARHLPFRLRTLLHRFQPQIKKPELTYAERQFAYNIFATDIQKTEQILNRDLSHWKI